MWWSWILTAVGVTGLYLAGRKVWWAWLIGLGAQVLWIAYALATVQYGFLVSAVAYGWVYGRNALSWYRDHQESVFPDGSDSGRREHRTPDEDREWWDHSNVSVDRSEMGIDWDRNRMHYTLAVDIEAPTQDQADAVHALIYKPFGGGKG
jgi:hypothetical protein